jgi:hypothetical protein
MESRSTTALPDVPDAQDAKFQPLEKDEAAEIIAGTKLASRAKSAIMVLPKVSKETLAAASLPAEVIEQ